jgi:alcohol dehydrogenase
MRAMAITGYSRPLEMVDIESPSPASGEVLIDVNYAGVCRTDLKIARGEMPFSSATRLPLVPGHEVVGHISAVGDNVDLEIGTAVLAYSYQTCGSCRGCLDGFENRCDAVKMWLGATHNGGFQEQLVVPAGCALPLPDGVDLSHAAVLNCGVGTAYHATITRADLRPGDKVVVIGCGGVGVHALQLALAVGAEVVVVDPSEGARNLALEQGAILALSPDDQAIISRVGEILRGGAHAVIDTSGAASAPYLACRLVGRGGRVVLVGYGMANDQEVRSFPQSDVVLREISILGSRGKSRGEILRVIDLFDRGVISPVVSEVLPLEHANEVFSRLESGRMQGRLVLEVAPWS